MLELSRWALAPAFVVLASPITWLEVAAFLLSIWMVVCNMRVHPLGWPLAIAASALYGVLFAHSKLYGEAALQLVFIAVSAWGWRQWLLVPGLGHAYRGVSPIGRRVGWWALLATLGAWPALALLLTHISDSDVPWLDAAPTAASVAGQWMLARKYLENWLVWLAVNIFSVALFAFKGLWLTALLYAIFAVLSVFGWNAWRRLNAARPVSR